jgi:hypothetical protein
MNMTRLEDIPEFAICPKCGQPLKVIDLALQAARLGLRLPEGSFVFRCCGNGELTIDDDLARLRLRDLLLAYHESKQEKVSGTE